MTNLLQQFAGDLGEDEDSVVRRIGDSLYVRCANDPAVLKITVKPGAPFEQNVLFQYIHPDHGQVDSATFVHTRAQEFSAALERLEGYRDIWFV